MATVAGEETLKVLLWHWGRRGGGPRMTHEIAVALRHRPGIEVHLSLSRQSELFPASATLGLPGFHVDSYTGLASAIAGCLRVPLICRRFGAYARAAGIDVVLCTMHHPWNAAVIPTLRRLGIPLVMMAHNAIRHPGERGLLLPWLLRSELRQSDSVLALSRHVQGQLGGVYGIPPQRISMIPHGAFRFSPPDTLPRRFPRGRAFRLLFFGRIVEYKGLSLLVDAYEQLRRRHQVELHIVGSGSIKRLAPRLRALTGVRLVNRWIPEEEVASVLADTDVLVLPYIEASQSGVVGAAFEAGMPAVATPVGGLVEQVRDRENGVVSQAVSAAALADAVAALIENPRLYECCAENAWKSARGELAWSSIGSRIEAVLRRVSAAAPPLATEGRGSRNA